jgi:competence protein ComEC
MTSAQKLQLVLIAGVAAGVATPAGAVAAVALAIAFASLALLWADRPGVCRACLALACGALAMAHGAVARAAAVTPPLARWAERVSPGDLRVAAPVRVRGSLVADAAAGSLGVRLDIRVESVNTGGPADWQPLRGRLQAHVAGDAARADAALWTAGRPIDAPVLLRAPAVYRNPGGSSPVWQALRRDADLTGTIKSAALVDVQRGAWWHETAAAARRHVRESARRYVAPIDPDAAAVVTAILIGDRAGLSAEVEADLQQAGTYHVIAISGGNIALLTALCLLVTRSICRSRRAATLITLVIVLLYGGVVGDDPSVRRAVMAASLYLVVDLAGLAPSALSVLGVVAAITVLVDPLATVDVGAWLSFGATFAIVVGAKRIGARTRVTARWMRPLIALMAATIAAELALLPVQAMVFNRVTIAGLVLNLIAIPAMAVVQIAGFLMVLCAGWFDVVALPAAAMVTLASHALLDSAALVRLVPWVWWRVPPVSWMWAAVYCAGWIALIWLVRGRVPRRAVVAVVVACGLVISTAPASTLAAPASPWLRVTLVDVGQGDAILVQFPSGHSMLVDAGGTPGPFDIGGRVVTPAAWALGVRQLDWLVLTHGDGDHLGGARAVMADLRPREVWEGIPVEGHVALSALQDDARAAGAVWRTVFAGQSMQVGPVTIASLHPQPPDWERRKVRNDDSLVLRLRYGEVDVLLTGDVATEFEARAAAAGGADDAEGRGRLRVLKVAHHGSRTSSSARFVDRYRPEIAVVSLGRQNLFGHPAPEVVSRLGAAGARLFRTDRHGAIGLETDGRQVRVATWTGVEWEVTLAGGSRPAGS